MDRSYWKSPPGGQTGFVMEERLNVLLQYVQIKHNAVAAPVAGDDCHFVFVITSSHAERVCALFFLICFYVGHYAIAACQLTDGVQIGRAVFGRVALSASLVIYA